jgi:hypothetical protein
MLLDLALGFGEETEVPTIARGAGERTDRERTRVPKGVEKAGAATQLADPLGAPREMVLFLARRLLKSGARTRIAGGERLTLVQRLRADFSDMIDPHQRRRMCPRLLVQLAFRDTHGRRGARRMRDTADRAQRTVELRDETVEARHTTSLALWRSPKKAGARRRPQRSCFSCFLRSCA